MVAKRLLLFITMDHSVANYDWFVGFIYSLIHLHTIINSLSVKVLLTESMILKKSCSYLWQRKAYMGLNEPFSKTNPLAQNGCKSENGKQVIKSSEIESHGTIGEASHQFSLNNLDLATYMTTWSIFNYIDTIPFPLKEGEQKNVHFGTTTHHLYRKMKTQWSHWSSSIWALTFASWSLHSNWI